MRRDIKGLSLMLGFTVFTVLLLGVLMRLGARAQVVRLLDWLDGMGPWGPLVFIVIQALVVFFLVPGVLFTLGAGFLFGVVPGTIYMVAGTLLGGSLAFLAARTLFRRPISRYVTQRPRLRALDDQISGEGWKIIMLTRMIPFFPFKLSNYCFGVMSFRFRDFAWGTAIGVLPITVMNVYAGSMAGDLATMETLTVQDALSLTVYAAGLAFLMLTVLVSAGFARKRLRIEEN